MEPQNLVNPQPVVTENQATKPQAEKTLGPVAGAIIVIIVLIAGGLYFWGAQVNRANYAMPYIPSDDSAPEVGQLESDASAGLPTQSSSDDISSIESDFSAMNMDEFDAQNNAELNSI